MTVEGHLVVDTLRSKKSSSALIVHNYKYQKRDDFQVAIQLFVVTTIEIYMRAKVVCEKRLNIEI